MTFSDISIVDHWPFVVVSLALGIVGQIIKGIVLGVGASSAASVDPAHTKPVGRAKRLLGSIPGWRWWYTKTLPFHAALIGALFGVWQHAPCPEDFCKDTVGRSLYYMAAGIVSSWAYEALRHFAKRKIRELDEGDKQEDADTDTDQS